MCFFLVSAADIGIDDIKGCGGRHGTHNMQIKNRKSYRETAT